METFYLVVTIVNILGFLSYLFWCLKKFVVVGELKRALQWDWTHNVKLSRNVTEAIAREVDDFVAAKLTDEKIKSIVNESVDRFVAISVSKMADDCVQELKNAAIQEVKDKRIAEVLAHIDTKSIANAMTLTAASDLMQRLPVRASSEYR